MKNKTTINVFLLFLLEINITLLCAAVVAKEDAPSGVALWAVLNGIATLVTLFKVNGCGGSDESGPGGL